MTFQVINPQIERAVLVGVFLRGSRPLLSLDESLDELDLLAGTAGIQVVGRVRQSLNTIDSSTYIGSGKIEEIKQLILETDARTVIFDDELSPRHQRELERAMGKDVKLLDRSALILDIFAQHARTREGALQVELAQYEYRLPRLTRQWTHLARQGGGGAARGGGGGVGLRGPGETQLEVDRREIGHRISKLKQDIEKVRQHRSQHRNQRRKSGIPLIALVGYTNAGKSTLLNAMTQSNVYVADQLFATLDPTTRRLELPSGRQALFSDTVGFIQKLPTTLVVAFRATLEEIAEADLILHVVDASHPNAMAHIEAVEDTLAEIDVLDIPSILVWNKTDRLVRPLEILNDPALFDVYVDQHAVSALSGDGLGKLLAGIEHALAGSMSVVRLLIPFERGDLVAELYETAHVVTRQDKPNGVMITVNLAKTMHDKYHEFET